MSKLKPHPATLFNISFQAFWATLLHKTTCAPSHFSSPTFVKPLHHTVFQSLSDDLPAASNLLDLPSPAEPQSKLLPSATMSDASAEKPKKPLNE